MERTAIPDKPTMRSLYLRGQFGNRWAAWSLEDFLRRPVDELMAGRPVGLMYNGKPGTQLPCYAMLKYPFVAMELAGQWVRQHNADPRLITVSEGDGADSGRVLNAEVMRSDQYFDVLYSTRDDYMRQALASAPQHAQGLRAVMLLRSKMDAASWDNLQDIFDRWPDSVVELTVYNRGVGLLGSNTVFWEVREY